MDDHDCTLHQDEGCQQLHRVWCPKTSTLLRERLQVTQELDVLEDNG